MGVAIAATRATGEQGIHHCRGKALLPGPVADFQSRNYKPLAGLFSGAQSSHTGRLGSMVRSITKLNKVQVSMEFLEDRNDFGTRLVQERRRLGRSQAEVARAGEVTKPTQLAYEQGARQPGLDYLLRVANSGLDLWFLLWGTTERTHVMRKFDWNRLAEIQEAMEQWALDNDLVIAPRKRIELSRLIYELGLAKEVFDPEDAVRVLKLVA